MRSSPNDGANPRAPGVLAARSSAGVTLVELMVVLAIVTVVGVAAWFGFRPSLANADARNFATQVRSARLEAIGAEPIAVVWRPELGRFERIDGDDRCLAPPSSVWTASPGTAVIRAATRGIVWLSDGTGRTCDGGGVYGGRVRFEDRRGEAWDVIVASSGRIRLERAP